MGLVTTLESQKPATVCMDCGTDVSSRARRCAPCKRKFRAGNARIRYHAEQELDRSADGRARMYEIELVPGEPVIDYTVYRDRPHPQVTTPYRPQPMQPLELADSSTSARASIYERAERPSVPASVGHDWNRWQRELASPEQPAPASDRPAWAELAAARAGNPGARMIDISRMRGPSDAEQPRHDSLGRPYPRTRGGGRNGLR